jgi:pimeloyl-ACP methyl ester carboxylesterase
MYLECRGRGGPTVVLVSGYGNGADVWSALDPGVSRPPVLAGVARSTRVCAYDRPNTGLLDGGRSRSDPVPQPRSAADAVAELHALLRAARLPGPYVLVGHSFGGLVVRLYASTHPRQVAGLVEVDATYERHRELFTPEQWAAFQRFTTLAPVPGLDPPNELVDLDASLDQMLRAKAVRPLRPTMPLVGGDRATWSPSTQRSRCRAALISYLPGDPRPLRRRVRPSRRRADQPVQERR